MSFTEKQVRDEVEAINGGADPDKSEVYLAWAELAIGRPGWDKRTANEIVDDFRLNDMLDCTAEIAALVKALEERGIESHQLDEAVHNMSQERTLGSLNGIGVADQQEAIIDTAEHDGSVINNDGLDAQVAFLFESGYTTLDQLLTVVEQS